MFHENAIETCTKTCTAACIEAKSILRYGWGQASIKNRTSLPMITGSALASGSLLAKNGRHCLQSSEFRTGCIDRTPLAYCQIFLAPTAVGYLFRQKQYFSQ